MLPFSPVPMVMPGCALRICLRSVSPESWIAELVMTEIVAGVSASGLVWRESAEVLAL